jgi:hypothetical protein
MYRKRIPRLATFFLATLSVLALHTPGAAGGTASAVSAVVAYQTGSRYFPQTGQTVRGNFLLYWLSHGEFAQQGYPISGEMQERSDTDGKTYNVQYFERAVLEDHPENQPPNDVLLSLLGVSLFRQKYPDNSTPTAGPYHAGSVLFPETGQRLGGKFLDYWKSHGGLAQQGYPISGEFTEVSDLNGKSYTIQYFERAVFEFHPENAGTPYEVLLSQLGKFQYDAKYGEGPIFPRTASLGCWTNYTNPIVDTTQSQLVAIDAVADNNVWAVGNVGVGFGNAFHKATLTMHWDGAEWRRIPSPNKAQTGNPPDPYMNSLIGVSGTSADDVWAVGPAMVLHWDGKIWSEVTQPDDGYLTAVAALSPTDVWVVGYVDSTQNADLLILHWDGKNWTRTKDVNFAGAIGRDTATRGGLTAIKAFSANDVWAVGSGSTPGRQARPIALHWDGAQWSAKLFDPRDTFVQLNALSGTGSQDLWAVGERRGNGGGGGGGGGYGPYVFTAHWDGRAWTAVDSPDPIYWKDSGGTLYGVSALGKDDVWAVGSAMPEGHTFSFLLHWDGQRWTVVNTPFARNDHASVLSGVTGLHGHLRAVGSEDPNGQGAHASIVHHAANCLDPTPVPSPTQRPPLPPTETPNPAP